MTVCESSPPADPAAEAAALVRRLHVGLQEEVADEMGDDEDREYLYPGHGGGTVSRADYAVRLTVFPECYRRLLAG